MHFLNFIFKLKHYLNIFFFFSVVDLKNLDYKVGDHPAECTITLDHEMMVKLGTGAMKAADALSKDLIQIDGQVELALALEIFIAQLNA